MQLGFLTFCKKTKMQLLDLQKYLFSEGIKPLNGILKKPRPVQNYIKNLAIVKLTSSPSCPKPDENKLASRNSREFCEDSDNCHLSEYRNLTDSAKDALIKSKNSEIVNFNSLKNTKVCPLRQNGLEKSRNSF